MINPTVMTFVQKTNEDPTLRVQVASLDIPGLLALAATQGYHFSQDEFISTLKSIAFEEISDEDLDHVAGGMQDVHKPTNPGLGAFSNNGIIAVLIGL